MVSTSERVRDPREYAYEALGESFERHLSMYDTRRRVDMLIDEFLPDSIVQGKTALDVGSGLGFFSQRLVERGAIVTACDIGPRLVELTRQRAHCEAAVVDVLELAKHFGPNRFDLVVSS